MASSTVQTTLIASVTDGYNEDDASVFSGSSSATLTTLDLSAHFTGYAAVRLRVTGQGLYIFAPYGYVGTLPTTDAGASGSNTTDNPNADSRGYVDTFTDGDGKISWKNYDGVSTTQIQLISHIEDANTAPTVTGTAPTTPSVVATNPAFSCSDDSGVVQATIDLEWTDPDGVTTDILINGAWQAGYNGTITANGTNGYDVEVTTHPDMEAGSWSATATVEDAAGWSGTDTWRWSVVPAAGYSEAIARGSGVVELFLRIDGTPYVIGTSADAPTDSWYTDGGFSYHQGLRLDTVRFGVEAHPGECWPETRGCDVEIDDPDGVLAEQFIDIESAVATELTASVADGASSISVVDTSDFASSGAAFLNVDAFSYTGKTATGFTGVTWELYGSPGVDHIYDTDSIPECIPEVTDVPCDPTGRRVVIYAAERVNGTLSATEQVWVGWVSHMPESQSDGMLRLSIDHILTAFLQGEVFTWMPSARMRGLYVPNMPGARWGRLRLDSTTYDIVTDGTVEFFESSRAFCMEVAAVVNAVAGWTMSQHGDGRWVIQRISTEGYVYINEPEEQGCAPHICGFTSEERRVLLLGTQRYVAEEYPMGVFALTSAMLAGYEHRIYLRSGEAQYFVASYARLHHPDWDNPGALPIFTVDTDDDFIVVSGRGSGDFGGNPWDGIAGMYGDGVSPAVSQVWGLHNLKLHEAVRLLYSGATYTGATTLGYTAPRRWLTKPCLRDEDVDWDELRDLVALAPSALSTVEYEITEPTEASALLTGPLVACGIYAVVKNDGTVGWRPAQKPAYLEADTAITATWLDAREAPNTVTKRGRERLLNAVALEWKVQYETDRLMQKKTALVVDSRSLQRYGGQPARNMMDPLAALTKRAAKLEIHTSPSVVAHIMDSIDEIGAHLVSTIIGLLGRPLPGAQLAVTPQARQVEMGDAVLCSSEWIRDTSLGSGGVSSKVALVLGWERSFAMGSAVDHLSVLIIDTPAGAIAPAARATAWDSGDKKLTFADTDLYHSSADDTDLDHFAVGDAVQVFAEGSSTATVHEPTIAAVDTAAGTIDLDTAPGITVPAIVRFQQYTDVQSSQATGGWVWIADDADGQVQDSRAGWRWV